MRRWVWAISSSVVVFLLGPIGSGPIGSAQEPSTKAANKSAATKLPVLGTIVPPSAVVGKRTTWKVTGQNLASVRRWLVSGQKVTVAESKAESDTEAVLQVDVAEGAEPGFRELRALGVEGLSNLTVIRVDTIETQAEIEPNDQPEQAQMIAVGSAVAGILKPKEYDYYRVELRRGMPIVIDVEAQRLGQAIIPVLTLTEESGSAIGQAMETRGLEHDSQIAFRAPRDGVYVIQIRDWLYKGTDSAQYRVRVRQSPVATGLFPLAGVAGQVIQVEASGGNLEVPRIKNLTVPNEPGLLADVGVFDGPDGSIAVPMRLLITTATEEPVEADQTAQTEGMSLAYGSRVNGRIAMSGEVDRYRVAVEKGKQMLVRVRASEMGSWLDSVVRVLDSKGNVLAENDDVGVQANNNQMNVFNQQPPTAPDSRLVVDPKENGDVFIELFDRYGFGGPEYGYRLEVGPSTPDFQITMLFGNPNLARRQLFNNGQQVAQGPGGNGSLTIKPGASVPLNFVVSSEGSVGKIEVRAEGLPEGVTAAPVTVTIPAAPPGRVRNVAASGGAIVLKSSPTAPAGLGILRVVATAKPDPNGPEITHTATARVVLGATQAQQAGRQNDGGMPVVRDLQEMPVWVAAKSPQPTVDSAGIAPVSISRVTVPGVLLQGGQLNLPVELEPAVPPAGSFAIEADVVGRGLAAQTLVTESRGENADAAAIASVRVIAAVDAALGVSVVRIHIKTGGVDQQLEVPIVVRGPANVRLSPAVFALSRDQDAKLRVSIERESGFGGPVELRLNLPKGLEVVEPEPWIAHGADLMLTLKGVPLPQDGETVPRPLTARGLIAMPNGSVTTRSVQVTVREGARFAE